MNHQTVTTWLQAVRVFSLTASVVPVCLGAAWAAYEHTPADWLWMPLIIIASLAIQGGTNLVSDYFDYVKGVDRDYTFGGSRVIVEGKLSARQVLWGGLFLFALTGAIGLVFIYARGWPILLIGSVGMLGGFFYTAAPVAYKYYGLGDAMVFFLMGPLMVIGSYFVLTGTYHHGVLLVSLPIGFLVAAILSGNNLRDILHDSQAQVKTTAGLLGHRFARMEYTLLVLSAYVVTCGLVLFNCAPKTLLVVLLTAPIAIQVIQKALRSNPNEPQQIATLDVETAKLHLVFGLLMIGGLFAGAWLQ